MQGVQGDDEGDTESILHMGDDERLSVNKVFDELCGAANIQAQSKKFAEGLQASILLCEDASVMITRNLWTSKGKF